MKTRGFALVSFFVFVGLALLVACAKPYHQENERYVFVATNIDLPYWKEAQARFLDAAKAIGVKAELIGPKGYQPHEEMVMFRALVEEQPTGVCLSAARPEILVEEITRAGDPWKLIWGVSSASVEAHRFDGAEPGFPAGGQFVNG